MRVRENSESLESDDLKLRDLSEDYEVLRKIVFNKLDPSLREKLTKPELRIIQNIYTGYDCEYQYNLEENKNDLLSSQLAVSTKSFVKITDRSSDYEFNTVSSLGNQHYEKHAKAPKLAYKRILYELRSSIARIRSVKGGSNDQAIGKMISGLKEKKVPFYAKDGSIVFAFDRTMVRE